ncbi:MAG: DUF3237 domain-containing protein [Bacteroidales bacterium]|nr:DUF3237 domain-containing protein [Bacteroidales bacterium]
MSEKCVLEIFVELNPDNISTLHSTAGGVIMIPFGGVARGEIFNGVILPGGVDTQLIGANGVLHMSARYMLDGTDLTGERCRIFIENNGYFSDGEVPNPFKTVPTFWTDSRKLAPYLHREVFRGEGYTSGDTVVIKIFEHGEDNKFYSQSIRQYEFSQRWSNY